MATDYTGDGDGDGRPAFAVLEANDYKQRRRLKELLDARAKVEEKIDHADELYYGGEVNQHGRDILVLHAVREFIRQGWNLLLDHVNQLEQADEATYFAERTLGYIKFPKSEREPQPVNGLYDYLNMPEYLEETWTESVTWRHGTDSERTHTERKTIPLDVSLRAYMTMCEFLAEVHDLEIQFEEMGDGLPNWGFEELEDDDLPDGVKVI